MPGTLVCDSSVTALMASKKIHAVLVGADRVAINGDTANKIGTHQVIIDKILYGKYWVIKLMKGYKSNTT